MHKTVSDLLAAGVDLGDQLRHQRARLVDKAKSARIRPRIVADSASGDGSGGRLLIDHPDQAISADPQRDVSRREGRLQLFGMQVPADLGLVRAAQRCGQPISQGSV